MAKRLSCPLTAPATSISPASGTADHGTDYLTLSGTVTIPSGYISATVTVDATADLLDEETETVTLTRRNYVELLEGGWIENGRKRLAKLKAELAADPDNKQLAFKVDVSQNHVDFQDRQLVRSTELIQMHEIRGTADRS